MPESDPDATYIICALADASMMAAGSSFQHSCARCKRRVMVAPSGQEVLKNNAAAIVRCIVCFLETGPHDEPLQLAASKDEVLRELESVRPNTWRERN